MAVQHLFVNVLDSGTGRDAFLLLYVMLQIHETLCNALSSVNGTSAHDTSFCQYATNALRMHNGRMRRSRRPADTQTHRQALIAGLQQRYAHIRTIKIKDSGRLFSATVKTTGGRTLHRTAYSLPRLAQQLCEGLNAFYSEPLASSDY